MHNKSELLNRFSGKIAKKVAIFKTHVHKALKLLEFPIIIWQWCVDYTGFGATVVKGIPVVALLLLILYPFWSYVLCLRLSLSLPPVWQYVVLAAWLAQWIIIGIFAFLADYH